MSDYLNNMAAKALGRQQAVRPRLASLFEPPTGAHAPLPAGPSVVETSPFEQTADAPATIRTPVPPVTPYYDPRPTPHESVRQPAAPASSRPDAFASETGRVSRETRPVTPASPRERESTGARQATFTNAQSVDDAPHPQLARTETTPRIEVVRYESRDARGADVGAAAPEVSDEAAEKVRALEGRVAALEASRADETSRREASRPAPGAVAHATPRPAAPPSTPPVAQPARARGFERRDEPPHVTVTIGRVDVRAIFPAPVETPRAPAPRPATNTLAEYLKQRERGRR